MYNDIIQDKYGNAQIHSYPVISSKKEAYTATHYSLNSNTP